MTTTTDRSARQDRQLKAWLRRQRLKADLRGNNTEAKAWEFAIEDDLAFETVAGEALDRYTASGANVGGLFDGFLEWLWDNREDILALVLKLVELFASKGKD